MKTLLSTLAILCFALASAQENQTLKIIAKRVSTPECDKICKAKYTVLQVVEGNLSSSTIEIGWQNGKSLADSPETAVLTVIPTKLKDYYIFPEYDEAKGVGPSRIEYTTRADWEACETGGCKTLNIKRKSANDECFIVVPCGGTYTVVKLTDGKGKRIREINADYSKCPATLHVTGVPDGKYNATVVSAGLNGKIEVIIATQ